MKYIAPSEKVVKQLPSEQVVEKLRKKFKIITGRERHPRPSFRRNRTRKEKGDLLEKTEVMEITEVNTGGMTPLNSNFREHSR